MSILTILVSDRIWFAHSGESGQQRLEEGISFVIIMHPLRKTI